MRDRVLAGFAVVVLAIDSVVAIPPSGITALAVMIVLTPALLIEAVRAIRARRAGALLAVLSLALACFAGARAWTVVGQLSTPAPGAAAAYDLIWLALAGGVALGVRGDARVTRFMQHIYERPRRVLSGSFVLLILCTAVALTLPISVHDVAHVSIIDALFTATSAVCVTGLTVNDVGTTYTRFGQGVILLAMQLGGVGIMTLAALAVVTARDAFAKESRYASMLEADSIASLRAMVRGVVLGTLAFEAIGATLLFVMWSGRPSMADEPVLWLAVFHSVSAFCNGGMSLFTDGLAGFRDDAATQLVVMALVLIGGLGFPVWRGLALHAGRRARHVVKRGAARPVRFDLGTRVALAATAVLVVIGVVLYAVLEWNNALGKLSIPSRLLSALFASVMTRTAGFNTVSIGQMHDATLLFTMVLMFVGGSPGSTAGGIKTTTAAVILAALRGELRGEEPRLLGRALAPELVRRAIAVASISALVVVVAAFLLSLSEGQPLRLVLFEVVSAFGTVGLTAGLTPELSPLGKLIIIATMFAGRVGPLTLALAVGAERKRTLYRLPHETLAIG